MSVKQIEQIQIVFAREIWGKIGTLIFPEGKSGVFIDGRRLPTQSIQIVVDKDAEYALLKIPLRIVDLEVIDLPPSNEVSWDEDEDESHI